MPKTHHISLLDSFCNSPAHRAVIGLTSAAIGGTFSPYLKDDLKNSDPQHLAKIANDNQVHTLIRSAFTKYPELQEFIPEDLFLYFSLIHSENKKRNQTAKHELETLGLLFKEKSINAVALKGAAEMITPYYDDPSHRLLSDLDILIPENQIDSAIELLLARGGSLNTKDQILFEQHHHIPGIEGGELPFRIELHKRIGDQNSDAILPAAHIFRNAISAHFEGIFIPSPQDRFTHHLIHCQLESQYYGRKLLNLRHCVDHFYFNKKLDQKTRNKTAEIFEKHHLNDLLDSLDTLTESLFVETSAIEKNTWAKKALHNFGRPTQQKYFDSFIWLKRYLIQFFTNPQKRKHYLKKITTLRGWQHFFTFHKDRIQRFR